MHKWFIAVTLLFFVQDMYAQDPELSPEAKALLGEIGDVFKGDQSDPERVVPLLLKGMKLQEGGVFLGDFMPADMMQKIGKKVIPALTKRIGEPMALEALQSLSFDADFRKEIPITEIGKQLGRLDAAQRRNAGGLLSNLADESAKQFREARPFLEELLRDNDQSVAIRTASALQTREPMLDEKLILPLLRKATRNPDTEDQEWREATETLLRLSTTDSYPALREGLDGERAPLAYEAFVNARLLLEQSMRGAPMGVEGAPHIVNIDMQAHEKFMTTWRKDMEDAAIRFSTRVWLAKILLAAKDEKSMLPAVRIMFDVIRLSGNDVSMEPLPPAFGFMNVPPPRFTGHFFSPIDAVQVFLQAGDGVKKHIMEEGLKNKDARIKITCFELIGQAGWLDALPALEALRKKEVRRNLVRGSLHAEVRAIRRAYMGAADPDPGEADRWAKLLKKHKVEERKTGLGDAIVKTMEKARSINELDDAIFLLSDLDVGRALHEVNSLMIKERDPVRVNQLQQRMEDLIMRSALPM